MEIAVEINCHNCKNVLTMPKEVWTPTKWYYDIVQSMSYICVKKFDIENPYILPCGGKDWEKIELDKKERRDYDIDTVENGYR